MKTLAVDIDGVLARDWGISRFRIPQIIANFLLFLPPTKYLYLRRKINLNVKEWIIKRKERGYVILIVSGTWEWHRNLIEKFLERNQIPFNYVVLSHPLFSPARAKMETKWDILLEDNIEIINALKKDFSIRLKKIRKIYVVYKRSQ